MPTTMEQARENSVIVYARECSAAADRVASIRRSDAPEGARLEQLAVELETHLRMSRAASLMLLSCPPAPAIVDEAIGAAVGADVAAPPSSLWARLLRASRAAWRELTT